MERCLNSMKERFVISQNSFTIKIIKKDGIKVIRAPEIPRGGAWTYDLWVPYICLPLIFLLIEDENNLKMTVKWYF